MTRSSDPKRKVLFLCTSNSCRSQMAEALVNAELFDSWSAFSAGSKPAKAVHPLALRVLAEQGISHQGWPKSINEFRKQSFDLIFTVCEDKSEDCPIWLGAGKQIHLAFPDPALATGSEDEKFAVFQKVRDDMQKRIFSILNSLEKKEN